MEIFGFLFFSSLLFTINICSPVVISLESFQSKLENDSNFHTIIDELLNSYISSEIEIGSHSYPLKAFFNIDQYFHISSKCHIDKSSSFNYKNNFNYNRYLSKSFYNIYPFALNFGDSFKACIATEKFNFRNLENNLIQLENMNFILNKDTDEDTLNCLQIGLLEEQFEETTFKGFNLITQLKRNKIVDEYCWTMKFINDTKYNNNFLYDSDELLNLKGNLIIGDFPHNFDSNNYNKKQYIKTYSSFNEKIMKWQLNFIKVYYKIGNKEEIFDDINAELNPSNYLIFSPLIYFESITKDYFQKYINKKICNYSILNEYISIYCNKSDKFTLDEIKQFPSIYFDDINLNYTFELSYKELFIEKNNTYWFLILSSSQYNTTSWKLGNIFMRKYLLVFNLDTKEIGF